MSNFCIISEFNPLHNGHARLLGAARQLGADTLTCVMSGNATQRGEMALLDKYMRAEAAIRCGADLVLELPFPWCAASADFFASGAICVADGICDTLLFGSECGDIESLTAAAELCESEKFKHSYEEKTKAGVGAATAYMQCLGEYGYKDLGSNDLLGLAYIRVIKRKKLNIKVLTVRRDGADYNESKITADACQSATAIRALVEGGKLYTVSEYVPAPMFDILMKAQENGEITDMSYIDSAVLCFLRLCTSESLEGIADTEGGLGNRILACAKQSTSAEQMLSLLRTKRYTDAKLRRALLFALTGVKKQHLAQAPEYTLLLGANARGRELLSCVRCTQKTKIITKPADAITEAPQYECSYKLDSIFSLAREKKTTAGELLKKKAYIEK